MAAAPFISSTYPFPTWLTSTSQRRCRSGCRAYCRPGIPASRYVIQRLLLLNVPGFQVWCASARRAAMACRKSSPRHGIRLADCHVEHAAPFSPSQVPLSVNLSFGTCGTHRYVSCTHYTRYISSNLVHGLSLSHCPAAHPPCRHHHPFGKRPRRRGAHSVCYRPYFICRVLIDLIPSLILRVLDLCRHRYRPRTPLLSPPLVTTPVPTAPPSRLFGMSLVSLHYSTSDFL